jgi:hypothetical protein
LRSKPSRNISFGMVSITRAARSFPRQRSIASSLVTGSHSDQAWPYLLSWEEEPKPLIADFHPSLREASCDSVGGL